MRSVPISHGARAAQIVLALLVIMAIGLVSVVSFLPAGAAGDPLRTQQWGLDALRLPEAWRSSGGKGVTIAIVDTGVNLSHPDLSAKLVAGRDLVDGDGQPNDPNGHGTHVAGIAAASTANAIGIAGSAPGASIMPVRVLRADGSGDERTIADGIHWAAANGADVINLSLGEQGFAARLSKNGPLNRAIRQVSARHGAVVIAAAGNEGKGARVYRPAVPVLVVGATDRSGGPAAFSNFGDQRAVVAPGVDIVSTAPREPTTLFPKGTDGYAQLNGTSMAAPAVAGVVALLLAGGHDPAGVRQAIFETAVNRSGDLRLGAGLVDAAAAMQAAAAGSASRPDAATRGGGPRTWRP
jgi:subtilisin family serine protease